MSVVSHGALSDESPHGEVVNDVDDSEDGSVDIEMVDAVDEVENLVEYVDRSDKLSADTLSVCGTYATDFNKGEEAYAGRSGTYAINECKGEEAYAGLDGAYTDMSEDDGYSACINDDGIAITDGEMPLSRKEVYDKSDYYGKYPYIKAGCVRNKPFPFVSAISVHSASGTAHGIRGTGSPSAPSTFAHHVTGDPTDWCYSLKSTEVTHLVVVTVRPSHTRSRPG